MALRALLPALAAAAVASAASAPRGRALHVDSLLNADTPTIFSVPEMQVPRPGWRALAAHTAAASVATEEAEASSSTSTSPSTSPSVHTKHGFLGLTDVGFVDYAHSAVSKPGTIHAADYIDLLRAATIGCAPVDEDLLPHLGEDGLPVRPAAVSMTLSFSPVADADALAHFLPRLSAPDAYLVFDHEFLASEAGFAAESHCGAQIPALAPYYAIASATKTDSGAVELQLTPASPSDLNLFMDIQLRWTPNGDGEVARRLAAGEPVGADARRRRRELLAASGALAGFAVNYDTAANTITKPSITIVAGDVLTCENCYAHFSGTYAVTVKLCLGLSVTAYSRLITLDNQDKWTSGGSSIGGIATDAQLADCKSLATTGTNSWVNPTTGAQSMALNSALYIEAYIEGQGGVGFGLSSKGFSTTGTFGSSCTSATDSSTCTPANVADFNVPPALTLALTGVSANINIKVKAAALYSGSVAGDFSFGASASIGTAANKFKLGGKINIPNSQVFASSFTSSCSSFASDPSPTSAKTCLDALGSVITPYTNFPLAYNAKPVTFKVTSVPTGSLDATLFTTVTVTVFGSVPIIITTRQRFQSTLATGTKAAAAAATTRRVLYGRELQTADTLATCPTTNSFISLAANGGTQIEAGPISSGTLITAFGIPSYITSLLPSIQVLPNIPLGVNVPELKSIVSACTAVNKALTGSVAVGASPIVSSGGGAATAGGGAAPAAASAGAESSGLSGGAVAGVVIGTLIGVGLIGAAAFFFMFPGTALPVPAFMASWLPASASPVSSSAASAKAASAPSAGTENPLTLRGPVATA
jgi:hypothetical protein